MTFCNPSDDTFASDHVPDGIDIDSPRSDVEGNYSDLSDTLSQLGESAAYHDVLKLEFNILEIPDLTFSETPSHTLIFTKTGSGKSKLVTQAQIDELRNNPQPLEA